MTGYTTTTVGQIIQEGLARLGKHRDEINLGNESMVQMINAAQREIELLTLPYKDWSYTAKLRVTHLTTIPQNYIKNIRLLVGYCEQEEEGD